MPHFNEGDCEYSVPEVEATEKPKGLYNKYLVYKADGSPVHVSAEYFVLKLSYSDNDSLVDDLHVSACRAAIAAYVENMKDVLPELAEDLMRKYCTN